MYMYGKKKISAFVMWMNTHLKLCLIWHTVCELHYSLFCTHISNDNSNTCVEVSKACLPASHVYTGVDHQLNADMEKALISCDVTTYMSDKEMETYHNAYIYHMQTKHSESMYSS